MQCPNCESESKKHGKDRCANQRFRCLECGKTFIETKAKPLGSMTLAEDKAILCIQLLVEGSSIRSVERITGVNRNTVLSLIETVGKKCLWIQENLVKNVKVYDIQADEIWAYIGMKDKTKLAKNIEDGKIGSAYTFTALDSDSKLIVAWHLGRRNELDTRIFLEKVANAIEGGTERFQLTTDQFKGYTYTVNDTFGTRVDYAQLHKIYKNERGGEVRYSPAECVGCNKKVISGMPVFDLVSTSYVERQNLTMRMSMRRFTRLTNGFSKKWENLNYSIALHFVWYNFRRGHKTLKGKTPAMKANLTQHAWTWKDVLATQC